MTDTIADGLNAGTLSMTGNIVRIDFETREEAETLFHALAALTSNAPVPAELVERALDALERGDWDLGDVGVIRAAIASMPPVGRVEEMREALVQAAVPIEAMLASRQSVDLPDTSWAEIENAVKHIRAALSGEGR